MKEITLRSMKKNQSGIISKIRVNGQLGRRLNEMGLLPGTEITLSGWAPLKDPVAIRIRNCILTLRNSEADHIYIQLHP